jgi:hypothetical protein
MENTMVAITVAATEKFLTRPQASGYLFEKFGLKVAPKTLGKLASTGGGPTYRRFGRNTVYTGRDLDVWVESKLTEPRRAA